MATFLLAAGGTGGHLFPAEALALELARRGHAVELATDERVADYGRDFPARTIHVVPSATFGDRSPLGLARSALRLGKGYLSARRLLRRLRPAAVVGFGGYPTVPPLTAAVSLRIPTIVHEANAVMGRANRFLAGRVTAVATGFADTDFKDTKPAGIVVHTGNPVRAKVLEAAGPYEAPLSDEPFRLVVFGGSQGARVFSDLVPPAIALLDAATRARLHIVQQVRAEDSERVASAYAAMGVTPEIAPFFTDLPQRISAGHLIVCRSGASTIAELGVLGRPSILVPLPHALDNDQRTNARWLERAGGAIVAEQASLDPGSLARLIGDLMAAPSRLDLMAAAAAVTGRTDAVLRLADLAERTAGAHT
ncbi:UDP-N-acetylglucosamine--N-acetylmuramyl-(pentapeptide) pyrophosphoryl-undecaprenol N-acetylglucosamine transferase [Methylobrevis pamukkalensis]|uniref:UDP-N-acetylglucosamine--N-acetylmuramyl-(pentapeptide) pyrophosphoryl-undecaprenol N-acetylglucosamine transferase n=1 Tax=Methylobrevis pamukkalensis TaxID=1439726 RepID=A0A1E3H5E2_9HYPH|nr:UDP-N-acetylglucosamine--N-acetylmuramyl-(pentapeptide) pyrophosphoryl-undecaprenol N-acetylglucosamine transferase [Methylobrevis pamukkalensis]ODN71558.1 UDP-N-acetylglucosamine--N-acetylmuramyl-(pentapeptide) pyrophosphoryl-undecaprenol N-acetylglucosamine transferase [Methylobrevis pamukkalensis]